MVVALLLACAGPQGDDSAAAAYLLDEDPPAAADLSGDALGALLSDAVALVRTLHGGPVFTGYDAAMSGAERDCPSTWTYNGQPYWADDCESADGSHFSGYAFHAFYDQPQPDGSRMTGETFSGAAEIQTASGAVFSGGGDAWHLTTTSAAGTTWTSGTTGSFSWDGEGAEGTWLATDVLPELTMTLTEADGAVTVAVDGGLTGMAGADVVVFDSLALFSTSSCPTEPAAVLSVRDTEGDWYDAIFDGPATMDGAAEACDGCGSGWFGGEPIGDVCVDFSPLTDWEEDPWD